MDKKNTANTMVNIIDKRISKNLKNYNIITQYTGVVTASIGQNNYQVRLGGSNINFSFPNKTNQKLNIGDSVYIQTIGNDLNTGIITAVFKPYEDLAQEINFVYEDLAQEINLVKDSIFYKEGDSFQIITTLNNTTDVSKRMITNGFISGGMKQVWFTIPLPKSVLYVDPVISMLKINIRVSSGGYLLNATSSNTGSNVVGGYDTLADNTLTVSAYKPCDSMLNIVIAKKEESPAWAMSGLVNNTPISISIENMIIDFITSTQ